MINFDVRLNLSGLQNDIEEFESRKIRVGVKPRAKVRKPDFKKGKKNLGIAHGKQALYVKQGGKQPKLRMTQLALILDKRYGVFSDASLHFADPDLRRVIEELAETFGKPVYSEQRERIENACVALVTNPIINKQFIPHSRAWAQRKGFNWPMVSTASFIKSIEGSMINV